MSNPPYGPGPGAPGNGPEDDWFRPAPQAREEIYRESEYGRGAPRPRPHEAPYDNRGQNGQPYDGPYGPSGGPGYDATTLNGSVGYDDDRTRLDGIPIRDADLPEDEQEPAGKEGWKKYLPNWKIVAGVCALGLIATGTLVGVGYATTDTPDLEKDVKKEVLAEGSSVYWDGVKPDPDSIAKPIFKIGGVRELVKIDQIPDHVQKAVMAAEQREFMSEGGISIKGLTRAVYSTVTGGQVQGGSTITQQLARNYLQGLSQERSLSRKYKEIFSAIKLDSAYPKEEILEAYLNTIDFGRGAQGIQAAARAYFGENVQKLDVYEGALLAAMIQRPSYFHTTGDPKKDPQLRAAQERWEYVLDGMLKKGWITAAQRSAAKWPDTRKDWEWTSDNDQSGYIRAQVLRELAQVPGIDVDNISTSGYKIFLSLDKNLMKAAKNAVITAGPKLTKKQKTLIRTGLVAVRPDSGEIVAFYGGDHDLGLSDAALVENKQVGSSFKPYVLAAMLKQNHNIKSLIDGRSPICLDRTTGDVIPGKNSPETCEVPGSTGYWMRGHGLGQAINMSDAMASSINTSFVRLALKLENGLDDVVSMAREIGIPEKYELDKVASLPLGVANYPAVYQASGYAAFANGGKRVTPHMIKAIYDASGKKVNLPWKDQEKQILTKDQADQVTYTLQQVVTRGTGTAARLYDRQAAGKTGTTEGGAATWFVGYTPQLSAAATVFHQNSTSMEQIIGESASYGGAYPAAIWKAFMTEAMKGVAPKAFDVPTYSGTQMKYDTPQPTPTKTKKKCNPLMELAGQCDDDSGQQPQGPHQNLPGCTQGQLLNCDPNKPPPGTENSPPGWWCTLHPRYSACHGRPGNPNDHLVDNDGDGVPAHQDPDDNDPNQPNQQHP